MSKQFHLPSWQHTSLLARQCISGIISDLPLAWKQPETVCNCLSLLCSYKTLFIKTGIEPDLANRPWFADSWFIVMRSVIWDKLSSLINKKYFYPIFIFLFKFLGNLKLQWNECVYSSSIQFDCNIPKSNKMCFDIFLGYILVR